MKSRHLPNAKSSLKVSKWIGLACAGVIFAGCATKKPVVFHRSARSVEPTTSPATAPSFASVMGCMMMWDSDGMTTSEDGDDSMSVAMSPETPECTGPQSCDTTTANSGATTMPTDSMAMSKPANTWSESMFDPEPTSDLPSSSSNFSAESSPSPMSKPVTTSSDSMAMSKPMSGSSAAMAMTKQPTSPMGSQSSMQQPAMAPSSSMMMTPPATAMPMVKDEQRFAAEAEFSAGHLAQTENRLDAAAEHFAKAMALNPRYPAAAFRLGVVKATMKQYDEAIEAWWTYVRLTDGSAESYSCLGYCFELAGKTSEAEAAYKRGIARDMRSQLCRVNYGLMLARLGREDESLAQLTVALSPAEAHYNIASIYELQGRRDRARAEYRRAKQCDSTMWQADARMRAMDDPRHANEGPAGNTSSVAGTRD